LLAEAAVEGLREAGHEHELVYADDVLKSFLRDCRTCRKEDGACSIDDDFRRVFLDLFLPADGFIAATPVYWYGMSAQLKAFFDRAFCYVAASYPHSQAVVRGMMGKRVGLLVSSEETFPTVAAGIVHQLQEYCRYTSSTFVGVVHGVGNTRGDVQNDPSVPLRRGRQLGRDLFSFPATDYAIDTVRNARVWG
jgi:multimeric flavodoxin WrbA